MNAINPDALDRIFERARAALEDRRKRTSAEIHEYPSPIAGCDQQFNHLLEERINILAELQRLAQIDEARSGAGAHAEALDDFLRSCAYIDERTKRELRDGLSGAHAAAATVSQASGC